MRMTVVEALDLLDADPDVVLESFGVKGVPQDPAECPVARFLHQATGREVRVLPDQVQIVERDSKKLLQSEQRAWDLARWPRVRSFEQTFDAGGKVALIDRPGGTFST